MVFVKRVAISCQLVTSEERRSRLQAGVEGDVHGDGFPPGGSGPCVRCASEQVAHLYRVGKSFADPRNHVLCLQHCFWLVLLRHAELCRAITQKVLHESSAAPRLVYFGVLRDHKETVADVENMVYSHWDGLADSPPKQRPQEAKPDPILNLLTWSGQSCGFPSSLLNKFATGTTHHAAMLALKEKVQATFPQNFAGEGSAAGGTTSTTVRAAGRPDFSIEGGKKPVDICRQVRLDALPADSFNFPKFLGQR